MSHPGWDKIVVEIIVTLALIIVTEFTAASALAAASGKKVGHSPIGLPLLI